MPVCGGYTVTEEREKRTGKLFTRELVRYDFDHPIRLTEFHTGGLDSLFYAVALSLCLTGMILILGLHGKKLYLEFTLGRTLLSFPLAVFAILFYQLLRELRTYPMKLIKQNVWTIDELMALTGKSRQETEQIITRVLEACFTVSADCILSGDPGLPDKNGGGIPPAEEPSAEESFSKFDD